MAKLSEKYEAVVVFSLKNGEDAVKALVAKFSDLIKEHGTLVDVDEWGARKLAYEINYETDGYYVVYSFDSKPDFPMEFERIINITDGVLRSIIVKKDPRFATAAAKPRKAAEPKPIDVEAVAAEAVEANESAAE